MNPLLEPTDEYTRAKEGLGSAARAVLNVIEDAIADGPSDYGWENRIEYPNGLVVIHSGGVLVAFLPQHDGTFLMLEVMDENAPPPWFSVE